MKLTCDDFIKRDSIEVLEDAVDSFMIKALNNAINELTKILGKKPEIKDIKEYILGNIFYLSKDIKTIKNELFWFETPNHNFGCNIIIDNDVIIFDSYIVSFKNNEIFNDFTYEIRLLNNGQCEVSLEACEDIKDDEIMDINDLGNMLRLLFFVNLIANGLTK